MAAASCERIEEDCSSLIQAADVGDGRARHRLFALFYNELHRMATRELRRNSSMTLTPTTLLHETFLSLSMRDSAEFGDRSRFMAYAARAMRGLIVDYLRRGNAQKRGRAFEITSLPEDSLPAMQNDLEVEQLGKSWLAAITTDQPDIAESLRQLLEETKGSPYRGFEWFYWQRQIHLASKTLRGHLASLLSVAARAPAIAHEGVDARNDALAVVCTPAAAR